MSAGQSTARDRPSSRFRWLLLALTLLALATLALLLWREAPSRQPYARYQRALAALGGGARSLATGTQQIHQLPAERGSDRCTSCHLASDDPKAPEDRPQPLRQHPGQLLRSHPPQRFGCTSCHGSGGAYLDRCLPARGDPDGRALNARHAQASCARCHSTVEGLSGAERWTDGLRAYQRLGCGGCHRAEGLAAGRRIGPPLDGLKTKLDPGYARGFLADPQKLRPGTAMPSFFSEQAHSGAPTFRQQQGREQQEGALAALLAFLYSLPPPTSWPPPPALAAHEAAAGGALFEALGCVACHLARPEHQVHRERGLGGIGPDLQQAAGRLSAQWVARWLASPRRLFSETRMPDFRLSPTELGQLTAFLSAPLPAQRFRDAARAAAASPLVRRGQELAQELGCPGCHAITPLNEAQPVGPELDGYGDKPLELLDWGHAAQAQADTWQWTRLKLSRPLVFDRRPGVLLMPWQAYRPGELEGVLLVLRSLGAKTSRADWRAAAEPARQRLLEGEHWLQALNCRQCHQASGRGGALAALYPRSTDAPPRLDGQGQKVQPAWLYSYLDQVSPLRPWLSLRMPTPNLPPAARAALPAFFAAEDQVSYPFVADPPPPPRGSQLQEALTLFDRFQCLRCHLLSNAPQLQPGELSPDLALARQRLRRLWIERFIREPQALMPGTTMPTLFPLQDEDDPQSRMTPLPQLFGGDVSRQIEALTDLTLWWGSAATAPPSRRK